MGKKLRSMQKKKKVNSAITLSPQCIHGVGHSDFLPTNTLHKEVVERCTVETKHAHSQILPLLGDQGQGQQVKPGSWYIPSNETKMTLDVCGVLTPQKKFKNHQSNHEKNPTLNECPTKHQKRTPQNSHCYEKQENLKHYQHKDMPMETFQRSMASRMESNKSTKEIKNKEKRNKGVGGSVIQTQYHPSKEHGIQVH